MLGTNFQALTILLKRIGTTERGQFIGYIYRMQTHALAHSLHRPIWFGIWILKWASLSMYPIAIVYSIEANTRHTHSNDIDSIYWTKTQCQRQFFNRLSVKCAWEIFIQSVRIHNPIHSICMPLLVFVFKISSNIIF